MHLAVGAAVAVATAVLSGALVVGDSVRGSLRDLSLQRLGRIDQALVTQRLFRGELAAELAATEGFDQHFESAHPALLLRGSAASTGPGTTRRASELNLVGVSEEFWELGTRDPRPTTQRDGVWLTEIVAEELGVGTGGEILVRAPLLSEIPADSPLGEKADIVTGRRVRVLGVLPSESLARFGVYPSQRPPRTIFFPLALLAEAIDQPGMANALLVAGDSIPRPLPPAAGAWLSEHFRPKLADYGLAVEESPQGLPGRYLQISSTGLVLSPAVVAAAERALQKERLQPITTYLANTIAMGERSIPYSTVSGVTSTSALGPLLDEEGDPIVLGRGEVVLNRWAADDLEAKLGDRVRMRYYEPESTHGELRESEPIELTLRAVVELTRNGSPTPAADPHLTPQLAGVTDRSSIADWDLPFELEEPIRRVDEDYWDEYSTTPKAFVSAELAEELWGTRWGTVSLLRLEARDGETPQAIAEKLEGALPPLAMGFAFLPVKQQGLAAASGTTPFDGLFLGFSMFLIAAAVMLLVLLFRLAIEQRARELGLLAAVGFEHRRMRSLLGREAMYVATIGAVVGSLGGIGYAWLMIAALTTLWVEAIAAPFLQLHVGPWSVLIGIVAGLVIAWWTIRRTLRKVLAESPRGLLAGGVADTASSTRRERRWPLTGRWSEVAVVAALGCGIWGATVQGEAQAGAFFGVGALVLGAMLGFLSRYLRHLARHRRAGRVSTLRKLALANLARRPGRSTLTIGLVGAASFLLLAISSFRLAPTEEGTGGFTWFATTDQPLHYDLATPQGRLELGLSDAADVALETCTIHSLRVHGGEDASCLNLYRTRQPRVIGVRDAEQVLGGFGWAAKRDEERAAPDLDRDLGTDDAGRAVVPVVLDFNTAMYSLHLSGKVGDRLTIRDGEDQVVTLEVVGLLKNSLLQGELIVSDTNFRRLFPSESGSQMFLIRRADNAPSAEAADLLEKELGDYGFDATPAVDRLESFLAVQNTYLSTFQSLGGLGLLLGTIGLAVVQLRNVLERKSELALLQAVGFPRWRVVRLVLLENLALLLLGLAVGGIAAILALLPQWGVQQTSLPWFTFGVLLGSILLVGLVASWLATRGALQQGVVPALRGE